MRQLILNSVLMLSASSVFAMPQEASLSLYGRKAEAKFNSMLGQSDRCRYVQNEYTDSGEHIDNVKMRIGGQMANSVECKRAGEGTYACEVSTLVLSAPCSN